MRRSARRPGLGVGLGNGDCLRGTHMCTGLLQMKGWTATLTTSSLGSPLLQDRFCTPADLVSVLALCREWVFETPRILQNHSSTPPSSWLTWAWFRIYFNISVSGVSFAFSLSYVVCLPVQALIATWASPTVTTAPGACSIPRKENSKAEWGHGERSATDDVRQEHEVRPADVRQERPTFHSQHYRRIYTFHIAKVISGL